MKGGDGPSGVSSRSLPDAGSAAARASQHRAIRANLIKTDGPVGGLPPINPALQLH